MMIRRSPWYLWTLLLVWLGNSWSLSLPAQPYLAHVTYYGIEQGLSHRTIYDVHQDQRGFIWMATEYGLNRFDGQTFRTWTQASDGLQRQKQHHLLEDGQGYLWSFCLAVWRFQRDVKTIDLVNIYTGEVITPEARFGAQWTWTTQDILSFADDEQGRVTLSLRDGRLVHFLPDGRIETVCPDVAENFYLSHYDRQGRLWGEYYRRRNGKDWSKLIALDPQGEVWYRSPHWTRTYNNGLVQQAATHETWWVWPKDTLHGGLYRIGAQHPTLVPVQQPDMQRAIRDLRTCWDREVFYQPRSGAFWVKTDSLLSVIHPEKGLLYDFGEELPEVAQAHLLDVHFDRDGLAWLGTSHGLYRVELRPSRFRRYLYEPDYRQRRARTYSCRSLLTVGDTLWVCSYQGRMAIDLKTAATTKVPFPMRRMPDGTQTRLGVYPLALMPHRSGELWFGGYALMQYDPQRGQDQITYWDIDGELEIWSIYQDSAGSVWVGSPAGMGRLDSATGQLRLLPKQDTPYHLHNQLIYDFIPSQQGHLWLPTARGLYAWHPQRGILAHWWTGAQGRYHLPHDAIHHLLENPDGTLWLATGGGGLVHLDPGQVSPRPTPLATGDSGIQAYRQISVSDGLPHNTLYAVYRDARAHLWISSDYGIIRFDPQNNRIRVFLPRDGITHQEFNRLSHHQAADGTLFFGGLNGLTAFHPRDFDDTSTPLCAPLELTEFQQYDQTRGQLVNRLPQLQQEGRILLAPGDRFFQLEFALLSYQLSEKIRYAWRIEGYEPAWTYVDDNYLRISGLPPGEYVLHIRGQDVDGRWSQEELHLPIEVLAPIHQRSWFWISVGSLLLLLIGGWYRWRTRQLKRRQQELEQLVAERTETIRQQTERLRRLDEAKSRFFANVSHELRTPLTLMLGPISSVRKRHVRDAQTTAFLDLARQHGQRLLQLITEILDLSRLESGHVVLHPHPVVLGTWLRQVLYPFELTAAQQEIDLRWQLPSEAGPPILLDVPKAEIILNNLMINALKFTPRGGLVEVTLSERENWFTLRVRDSGPGIHPEDLPHVFERFYQAKWGGTHALGGTGIGLAVCLEYARLFGGNLRVESEWGQGATFCFDFPKHLAQQPAEESTPAPLPPVAAPVPAPVPAPTGQNRPTLLVVEDYPDLQRYLHMMLSQQYQLHPVANGQQAWEWLQDADPAALPDLILTDVMMPEMDGFELVARLKEDSRFWHLPVVMLTARAAQADRARGLRIGVDDYLVKPFEEDELTTRLANLLRRAKERQQLPLTTHASDQPEKHAPDQPLLSEADLTWLAQLEARTQELMEDFQFTIDALAADMAISRRQLHRRIKQLTGLTPNQYVLEVRLQRARYLLETKPNLPVKVVAYEVGMKDVKYFSRKFKERFGKVPSAYAPS